MRNVHTSIWVFILSIGSMVVSAVAKPNNNILLLNPSVPVLDSLPALCQQAQPLNLLQFVRSGTGTFSGPGVVSGTFAPSLAGLGRHILSFTYFDSATQSNLILYPSITVRPLPNYTYTASGSCLGSMLNFTIADTALFFWDWKLNGSTIKRSYISYQWQAQLVTNQNLGLFAPEGMFLNSNGDIYIADTENHRVLRITPSGASFVVAGGNGAGPMLNQTMHPRGLFVDATGALYVSESGNNRVTKWLPGAAVGVVVAGAANGAAGTALNRLNSPKGIWVRPNGDLFIADMENHRVVRWANGATSGVRVAGTGIRGGGLNELNYPWALAMDTLGRLFVSDIDNRRVMRYDPNVSSGVVVAGGNGWGSALNQFTNPFGISVDRFGYLYVADYNSNRVMRFAPGSSDAEIIVGNGAANGSQGQLSGPITAFLDRNGSLVVLNRDLGVRRFLPEILTTDSLEALNNGVYEIQINSLNDECSFLSNSKSIFSPIVQLNSSAGYNVCEGDTTILSIIPNSTFYFQWFKDNMAITGANTHALSVFQSGLYHVIVSDSNQCSTISEKFRLWPSPIANLSANGICVGTEITTNVPDSNVFQIEWYRNNELIKQVNRKYQEEGEPVLGNFNGWINNLPFHWGIGDFHIHTDGSIYVYDIYERRVVRYYPSTGQFTVVAGGNGEGNALNQLNNAQGIYVTPNADLFIADMGNHRVVRWAPGATQGVVVAGATGVATAALNRLNHPSDVFIDAAGNMFIADNHNHRVVRWAPGATTGVLVAGTSGQAGSGMNQLQHPHGVYISRTGQLFVSDNNNHRVMRYNLGSTAGIVVAGGNGAGPGLNQLRHPNHVFVDDFGNLIVADNQNHRVMRWRPGATSGEVVAGGFGSGGGLNQVPGPGALKLGNGRSLYVSMGGPRLTRFDLDEMPADTLPITASGSYSTKFTTVLGCENTSNTIEVPRLFGSDTVRVFGADTLLAGLNGGAYQQYLWSTGSTDSTLLVNATGMYQLTATDTLNGCSREQQIFVYLGRASIVASETEVCEGSQVRLSVSADNLMSAVSWQPIHVRQTGGHNGSITAQSADSIQIWGNSYNDPTFVILGSDSVSYGEISTLLSMPSPNAIPDPKAFIGMMMQSRAVSGGTTFSAAPGYVFSMVHGHVYLEDRLKSGNTPIILASKAIPGLDFSTPHQLKIKLGLDDTLRCYLNDQEVLKHGIANASIIPGYFAIGGHNTAYTFKDIRIGGSLTSILWSTGDSSLTINRTFNQTTSIGFEYIDGGFVHRDSITILVRVSPSGINLPDTISVCGDSVVLDPGFFDGYLWSTGDSTREITVKKSGTYSVYVDSNDCSSYREVYVSLVKSQIVTESTTICQNESTTLSAYSNQGYLEGFFDGNRYLRMPNPGPVGSGARTIMFWVKPKESTPMPFVSYGNMASGTSLLTLGMNVGVGNCPGADVGPSILSNSHFATFRRPINLEGWTHIAYVLGGSNASFEASKVYMNGVLISQGVHGTDFCGHNWGGWQYNTTSTPMDVGYSEFTGRAGTKFKGDLDELAIWNRNLTTSEIQLAMQQGPERVNNGLVNYYPFDDLQGDTLLRDIIGNNHGIVMGGAFSSQVVANYIGNGQRYLWSTGDTLPVINVTPQQTTTYYLTVSDGITTCMDSLEVFVNPVPVVNLTSADSLIFCEGGSALLVADSVPGATYRWIQEDGIVGGLMVEVFSTHAGVGSSNDYPGYPTSRAEFDKFFDTTYQSTSLHYQGRHNALQSLNWSGMSALTNVGIAVPNNGDFFAVQVSGFFNPSETGTYRFNASSDDAMDFIIGDSLVLSSYMANNGQFNLQAGQRVFFKARMQEYGGHESFNLSWEKPSQLNTGNWQLDTLELNGSRGAVVLSDTGRSITASESGIYRAEVTTSTGCTVSSNGLQIEVLPLPVVTLASFDPVCLTDSVTIPLTGGWPVGGIFSGTGVSNGVFDPLVAGAGIHEISYTYTDSLGNGCTNTATQQMVVLPLAVNLQVDDYCAPSQAVASIADSSVYGVRWFRNSQLIAEKFINYEISGLEILGNLSFPRDMCFDHVGNIYVVESNAHRVIRYSTTRHTYDVVAGGNGQGTNLNQLSFPTGVAVDQFGNVFVADNVNHRIVRWSPGGSQGVVVAGNLLGVSGSGLNFLNGPHHIQFDTNGMMYVSDFWNNRILRYSNLVSTTNSPLSGVSIISGTGAGSGGQFSSPMAIFIDKINNQLYVDDFFNKRVLRFNLNATNISGSSVLVAGGNGAGSGLNQFSSIGGICVVDSIIYISDDGNSRIVSFSDGPNNGKLVLGGLGTGPELFKTSAPVALRVDRNGKIIFLERDYGRIVSFSPLLTRHDTISLTESGVYHVEFQRYGVNCVSVSDTFMIHKPMTEISSSRGLIVCENDTTTLSSPAIAGYVYQWYKDGSSIAGATTNSLMAFEPGLYHVEVSDSNNCIKSSEVMRIWPKPNPVLSTDGVCLGAELRTSVPDSNVVQLDLFRNNQIFRSAKAAFKSNGSPLLGYFNGLWMNDIEPLNTGLSDVHVHHDGTIYVVAQTNFFSGFGVLKYNAITNDFNLVAGGNGFGSALNQIGNFSGASGGLFVTDNGDIYVADRSNHRVMKWVPGATQGIIVAGGNGSGSGLNQLNNPQSVYVSRTGDVFVVDQSNHRVVRWSPGANAGVVVAGGNGAGAGLNQFNDPRFVTANLDGDLFVSDQNNHRVMRYAPGASTGVVVAGGNFSGSALNQLNQPNGIAVDKLGNVFVADRFNNRVVRWAPNAVSGEIVAGLNQGNALGLDRTTRPVGLRLSSDYTLYVTSVDTVNGSININANNRLTSYGLDRLEADSLIAQSGGEYRLRFTNVSGCSNASEVVTIFDPQLSFPAISNLCVTDAGLPLNMATPAGGTYFGLGVDTGYFHPDIAGVGTHTLYYLFTDTNGCAKLDSQTIQVVPEPIVTIDTIIGNLDMCFGESVTLQSPLVSGQNYQWYRNGVLIPQATQRSYTVRDSVSAQYHVMVTRNICERSSDTLMVIVRPKPVVTIANLGASTICQGDSVILQAASDTDVSYQWYRNGQLLAGSTQSSLVANQTGNYICQVVKANGCADTSNTLSLTVLDYPIAQITPVNATTVCSGQAVILNANQGTGLSHRWFRNGALIAGATAASYQATQSGDYTVEVKRQQLCAIVSAPVTVVVNPLPQIAIQVAQGGKFCNGDSIQITAQSTSQVLRYAWFRNGQLLPSDSTGTFFARLPGFYHARVFDTAGCDKASDSVQVGYFDPPFANENICAISVDTLTGRNVVVWEKTANVRTAAYNIYREGVVTGQYINIGRVPFDSMSTFTDTTANPLSQSFRYRIAVVDSCGFESARSAVHRTIHLSSNVGVNNEVNLFWTAYEGVPVPTHRILRSVNGAPFVQIAQVSGTTFTYTDLTPPQGAKNYLIEIEIPGGCSPTGLRTSGQRVSTNFTSIRSNRVAVGQGVFVRNVRWNEPSLYPNPTSGKLYLKLGADLSDRQFEVYDARGRLVRRVTVESREEPHEFDFSMEADGVYTIRSVNSEWKSRFVISK